MPVTSIGLHGGSPGSVTRNEASRRSTSTFGSRSTPFRTVAETRADASPVGAMSATCFAMSPLNRRGSETSNRVCAISIATRTDSCASPTTAEALIGPRTSESARIATAACVQSADVGSAGVTSMFTSVKDSGPPARISGSTYSAAPRRSFTTNGRGDGPSPPR
jgi:hypothetical protein